MSVYDNREQPAYGPTDTDPSYCANPYILKWWSDGHDQLIAHEILEIPPSPVEAACSWAW